MADQTDFLWVKDEAYGEMYYRGKTVNLNVWQCRSCEAIYTTEQLRAVPYCPSCTAARIFGSTLPANFDPEEGGKLVRLVWINYARQNMPNAKASWLAPWEECPPHVRAVDIEIGSALFQVFVCGLDALGVGSILQQQTMRKITGDDDGEN
jgi:hypothetical protein